MAARRSRKKSVLPMRGDAPAASSERVIRLGGLLVDVGSWPDDVVERIKRDYLLPPATTRLFLARVTMTATCPARHITQHPVGIMADKAAVVQAMCDGLPKARVGVNCSECGKQATVTGKHVYWVGPMAEWDGAV
jgi:hypothetical protein